MGKKWGELNCNRYTVRKLVRENRKDNVCVVYKLKHRKKRYWIWIFSDITFTTDTILLESIFFTFPFTLLF